MALLPALAFGLSALMLFSAIGVPVSPMTLVIGHTVVCVPYVIRTTVAALAQLDPVLLESSASLGASRWQTFRRVILPATAPQPAGSRRYLKPPCGKANLRNWP